MHSVTKPTPPFRSGDGKLEVHQIPAWRDNFIWLAVDLESGEAAAIDGPEAKPVLAYCEKLGIDLRAIFNTHTHPDHVGINAELSQSGLLESMRVVGPARAASAVPGITEKVDDGALARLGTLEFQVLLTEGHIDGHVSYVYDDVLFCGDTLFGAGCGYLFDGPPAKMHRSLGRLIELSPQTRVCCAHEYTEDNLRFAWSVEPDNPALGERIRHVWALRAEGRASVPSTIGDEIATNPFVRHSEATLIESLRQAFPERPLETPEDRFAATRELKDRKDYRSLSDADLPLSMP